MAFQNKKSLMHFEFYKHLKTTFISHKSLTMLKKCTPLENVEKLLSSCIWHVVAGSTAMHLNFSTQIAECFLFSKIYLNVHVPTYRTCIPELHF